jgi:hypothetical protein
MDNKFSFRGYSLKTWFEKNKLFFIKNKETIKGIITGIAGIIAASYGTSPLIQLLFGAGGAYLTRFIIDGIDYYLKE